MKIDFTKSPDNLVPAIVQDNETRKVLMLGYMNEEALNLTRSSGKVTFYSRSKQRLWTKGEESGNYLQLVEVKADCDADALLVYATPQGPTCHTGSDTCWNEENDPNYGFLSQLEGIIADRKALAESKDQAQKPSYVASLFQKGINKIAQKVGEEAVETVIEAKDDNDDLFLNESADLLFHLLILLQAKGYSLQDIVGVLKSRH
ncbi:bifunctional phosphoribosyl-AMP cyclohydrolase/phosphoribosyl-ATP diphosphatase HisIE [Poritiphilus flavus]|uniref:Histidine biosynthesis bifunctional protein HisIE n=1 Tax=Poritiphilus flavus TaxID=2697053 RepID=A0A6L9EG41_9FLAO|nr:bifunctional phosphoribosyl-AMP cyclohydrolase/phosphoribosyl-ATP diphosphatase HisIE [Poritiphilus flavus]NAS13626.1 bifunctional phosphoribosyl-AMP cyclohydrolase/phosphoribosyl-ATP diphosphatase HisIE [Poritiphilus flavus]